MNTERLLRKIKQGNVNNVALADLHRLLVGLGFDLARVRGSHHVYSHLECREIVNVQEVGGQAKPYQVRQIAHLIDRYNLELEA
ncbi:MAG: hypothetical protein DCC49_02270 [Acidobacteria bacterium]|nr:MAG: hypothetical protein DCC49_02270 [Acidobacteriota bacterium]